MQNGIALVHRVGPYTVSETDTKRDIDNRRFNVQKAGNKKAYVVTFQGKRGAQCSCPGGIFHGNCKHVGMCRAVFS